jgi:putative hemolysin
MEIAIIAALLLISGAFSGTEVAFTSLSVEQLEHMKRERGIRGRLVAKLYDELDVVLTSITIGNNMANLAASALVSALTIRLFGETWLTVSTVVLTLLVLVFGEVTPKQIGILNNEFVTIHMSRFLRGFSLVFSPAIWLIRQVSNALTRLTGRRTRPRLTLEGFRHLVGYARNTGVLSELDSAIVRNVIRTRGVRVAAVMTHRTKIFSLDKRSTVQEVFPVILESGFSRIPVFDFDSEHIVGVALLKDAARALTDGHGDLPLSRIMTEPVYVPESRTVHQVLTQLKREHLNMAIILDEYGGLAGLVTVEDLVEEFVGELYDEGEIKEEDPVLVLGDNQYRINGDAPLHVVSDLLDLTIDDEAESETVGGYITERLGRIPAPGEQVDVPAGSFTVESVTSSRVIQVLFNRRARGDDE